MAASKGGVSSLGPRLAFPAEWGADFGISLLKWTVIVNSVFKNAETVEGVANAILYGLEMVHGDQAKLIPFLNTLHIVPSKRDGQDVETHWHGVAHWRGVAQKAGLAGIDPAVYGPIMERTFVGEKRTYDRDGKNTGSRSESVNLRFPEWAEVTVYSLAGSLRVPTTKRVYWMETYSRGKYSEMPSPMWIQRPFGQLDKCAEVASLRAAFSEIGYAAEEMEGKELGTVQTVPVRHIAPAGAEGSASTSEVDPSTGEVIEASLAADYSSVSDHARTITEKIVSQIHHALSKGNPPRWGDAGRYLQANLTGNDALFAKEELSFAEQEAGQSDNFLLQVATLIQRAIPAKLEDAKDFVRRQSITNDQKAFAVLALERAARMHVAHTTGKAA